MSAYKIDIPATMAECEDALIAKLEDMPDSKPGQPRREMTELEKRLMKQYYKRKTITTLAEVFGVCRHTIERWKREIIKEETE